MLACCCQSRHESHPGGSATTYAIPWCACFELQGSKQQPRPKHQKQSASCCKAAQHAQPLVAHEARQAGRRQPCWHWSLPSWPAHKCCSSQSCFAECVCWLCAWVCCMLGPYRWRMSSGGGWRPQTPLAAAPSPPAAQRHPGVAPMRPSMQVPCLGLRAAPMA